MFLDKKEKGRKPHPFGRAFLATVISAVIATLAATFLTYIISTYFEEQREHKALLSGLQNIYIGSNKDWIDAQLGPATFSSQEGDYLQCVYLMDVASVRVFYDMVGSNCCAFFVTQMKKESCSPLKMADVYSFITDEKPLGEFNYYELAGQPQKVFGFRSQGNARALYGESYYYASSGNYYDFYFLSLDYGEYESFQQMWNSIDIVEPTAIIDEEVTMANRADGYIQLIRDRKSVHPNTYGISIIPSDTTIDFISSYQSFDSIQLRNSNIEKFHKEYERPNMRR